MITYPPYSTKVIASKTNPNERRNYQRLLVKKEKKFMKLKHIIATLSLAAVMAVGVGAVAGGAHQEAKSANADNATVYCKMEHGWWTADSAAIGVHYWGGSSAGTAWPGVRGTAVATDDYVWKFSVPSDITGLMFTRINGSGDVIDWGAKTGNLTLQSGKLYTITSSSAVWGDPGVAGNWSSGTYLETALNLSLSFYAGSANENAPTVHAFSDPCLITDTGEWPGTAMSRVAKNASYKGSGLYKFTLNYKTHFSDHSDVHIGMVLSNGGDSNKSADIGVITNNGYYSPFNGYWYDGYGGSVDEAALLAERLATVDICNLTKSVADGLRDDMETYASDLASATWDGFTYQNAYDLVDSQCTSPKSVHKVVLFSNAESNNAMMIVTIVSLISLSAIAGYFLIRKRKEN